MERKIDRESPQDNDTSSISELIINEVGEHIDIYEKDRKSFDVNEYMKSRIMTPIQEKLNAWTMIIPSFLCLYFLLSGKWLSEEAIEMAQLESMNEVRSESDDMLLGLFAMSGKCINNSIFPLHAFPPLPLVAIFLGIVLHAPFSFLYHWKCATVLSPGIERLEHWSRRMDQSMIHVCNALLCFGTCGRWEYFLINVVYNLDCIFKLFQPNCDPKRNKIRILISILGYTTPLLRTGCFGIFLACWFLILLSGFLFLTYPLKGWSHAAMHLVGTPVPVLLMVAGCSCAASKPQIMTAARCAILSRDA